MLGNLFRESGVTDRLSDTSQNALINTVTIFLATGTGLTMSAEHFLSVSNNPNYLFRLSCIYRWYCWWRIIR